MVFRLNSFLDECFPTKLMQWLLFVHLPRLSDTPRNWLDQKKNKFSVKVNSTLRLFDLFLKAIKRSYIWLIYTRWIWIGTLAWTGSRALEIRKRIDQSHNATDSKKSVTAAEIPSVGPKFVNENNLPPPPPKKKKGNKSVFRVTITYHVVGKNVKGYTTQ